MSMNLGYLVGTAIFAVAFVAAVVFQIRAPGLGYVGGAIIFGALLVLVAAAYFTHKLSRTILFWLAFVLTRPLGAVIGDFLDKPRNAGGLALSRYSATATLLAFIVACIVIFPQRAARRAH